MTNRRIIGMAAAGLVAACVGAWSVTPALARQDESKEAGEVETHDVLTFRNGRVVEGHILSETATSIEMKVVVAGISTTTTYSKTDVLAIERNVPKKVGAAPEATAKADEKKDEPKTAPRSDAAKVYLLEVKGIFGRDVSETPLSKAFDDAASMDPDVIVVRMDSTQDNGSGFDGLFRAEAMTPIVEKAIGEGRRVVFWIKEATVGAAFLPFVSPEIYFMSDGRMGGIGTLQDFDIGDERVNEKQISLRLGHAEGIAITGGYAPELVRAMARSDYWLSFRSRGGQIEYKMTEPTKEDLADGWILLSDDGKGKNEDSMEDSVRKKGNDVLNLDEQLARTLRVSKGTADTLDDLVFALGFGSNYTSLEGKGSKILEDWADRVDEARDTLRRLREQLEEANQGGGGRGEDAREQIGKQIRLLKDMRGLLSVYSEVFDPSGQQRAQIDVELESRRQALQRLTNNERSRQR